MAEMVDGSRDAAVDEVPSVEQADESEAPAPTVTDEVESTPRELDETPPVADRSAPAGSWMDQLHPAVRKHAETIANHPYVARTASALRQRAGAAQERMQPIVNHPYVQQGSDALKAGGTKTVETGKKVYNNEPGYEPKRFAPLFAATVGLILLGLIIRGFAKWFGHKDEL